jgi:capsid protein
VDEFYRARNADAAAALGLARGYAEMAVTNSYTAHRGESLLTWATIYDRQKTLERTLLDWLAVKVLERAVDRGELAAPPDTAWRHLISWDLPTMPPINEKASIDSQAAALKAGLTTYKDLLGSDWDEKIRQLATETDLIRSLGLPLAYLETVSGAPAGAAPSTSKEDNFE